MVPARMTDTDAAFNLGLAVAALQTMPPGVWIAMSGRIFAGRRGPQGHHHRPVRGRAAT